MRLPGVVRALVHVEALDDGRGVVDALRPVLPRLQLLGFEG